MIEKAKNIGSAWGWAILFATISGAILNNFAPGANFVFFHAPIDSWRYLFYSVIFSPFAEEFIFRYVPVRLLGKTNFFKENSYYIMVVIGLFFGYLHGGYYNIFIQGIPGIFFGWVYLKNGDIKSAIITHFLYNFMLDIVFPQITTHGL